MNSSQSDKLSWLIIWVQLSMVAAIYIFYLLNGFDNEEIKIVIGFIGPIISLYAGFSINNLKSQKNIQIDQIINDKPIKKLILIHNSSIFILILIKALAPNFIDMNAMIIGLAFIQLIFGAKMADIFSK